MYIRLIAGVLFACCAFAASASAAATHSPLTSSKLANATSPTTDRMFTPVAAGGYPTCPPVTGGTYPACGRPVQCPAPTSGRPPACVAPPCPANANCKTGPRPGGSVQNASVKLGSAKRLRVDSRGRVKLATASCAIGATQCRPVKTRLQLPGKRKAVARGNATLKVAPGQVKALYVRLSAPALRSLRRAGSLTARVVVISGTAKALRRIVVLQP